MPNPLPPFNAIDLVRMCREVAVAKRLLRRRVRRLENAVRLCDTAPLACRRLSATSPANPAHFTKR